FEARKANATITAAKKKQPAPDISHVVLHDMSIVLAEQSLHLEGSATYLDAFLGIDVPVQFTMDLRVILHDSGAMIVQPIVTTLTIDNAGFSNVFNMALVQIASVLAGPLVSSYLSKGVHLLSADAGMNMLSDFDFAPLANGRAVPLSVNDAVIQADGANAWIRINPFETNNWAQANRPHIHAVHRGKHYVDALVVAPDDDPVVSFEAVIPLGHHHPEDPFVRIRWEVYGSKVLPTSSLHASNESYGPKVLLQQTDHAIQPSPGALFGPKTLIFMRKPEWLGQVHRYEIRARIYRPWGQSTQELCAGFFTLDVSDRLRRDVPFVRWKSTPCFDLYTYRKGHPFRRLWRTQKETRQSRIHLTDPAHRCRFADAYPKELDRESLDYLVTLPVAPGEAGFRELVCDYCFYGGPDKSELKWTP
ncbi:MAG: hypothetical protein KC457_29005, partial [Myxococcales bacterium]|nr:hypothetical protein [Myxococcales bacterium]